MDFKISPMRIFRIILGLGLVGYGTYSGIYWFYLGIVPMIAGILDWCPMCKFRGNCDVSKGKK